MNNTLYKENPKQQKRVNSNSCALKLAGTVGNSAMMRLGLANSKASILQASSRQPITVKKDETIQKAEKKDISYDEFKDTLIQSEEFKAFAGLFNYNPFKNKEIKSEKEEPVKISAGEKESIGKRQNKRYPDLKSKRKAARQRRNERKRERKKKQISKYILKEEDVVSGFRAGYIDEDTKATSTKDYLELGKAKSEQHPGESFWGQSVYFLHSSDKEDAGKDERLETARSFKKIYDNAGTHPKRQVYGVSFQGPYQGVDLTELAKNIAAKFPDGEFVDCTDPELLIEHPPFLRYLAIYLGLKANASAVNKLLEYGYYLYGEHGEDCAIGSDIFDYPDPQRPQYTKDNEEERGEE